MVIYTQINNGKYLNKTNMIQYIPLGSLLLSILMFIYLIYVKIKLDKLNKNNIDLSIKYDISNYAKTEAIKKNWILIDKLKFINELHKKQIYEKAKLKKK